MEKTRQIHVGTVAVGGGAPIAIQSMSTFSPVDTEYAAAQINALHKAGADIVRVAVPDKRRRKPWGRVEKSWTCRWWRTSISTTAWP